MKRLAGIFLLLFAASVAGQTPSPAPPPMPQPSVQLPAALDRVLRDYETSWRAKDPAALAALFTEDGFVLSSGGAAVRGRAGIREAYSKGGGPLFLRAFAYSIDGSTGYIIGGFRSQLNGADSGKFVLALRKGSNGKWLIAADMDNSNQRPRSPQPPVPPTAPTPPPPVH